MGTSTHLQDSFEHVDEEQRVTEPFAFSAMTIQFREGHHNMVVCYAVEQSDRDDRSWEIVSACTYDNILRRTDREERVPPQQIRVFESTAKLSEAEHPEGNPNSLGRTPTTVDLIPPQHANTDDILVEEVDDPEESVSEPIPYECLPVDSHIPIPRIRPVTMHEQQTLEEAELRNRIVGRVDSLQALLAGDAHTNVCGLNHGHVVGAIADCKRHGVQPVLDHLDHERFLQRRDATADDAFALHGQAQEESLVGVVRERL